MLESVLIALVYVPLEDSTIFIVWKQVGLMASTQARIQVLGLEGGEIRRGVWGPRRPPVSSRAEQPPPPHHHPPPEAPAIKQF